MVNLLWRVQMTVVPRMRPDEAIRMVKVELKLVRFFVVINAISSGTVDADKVPL
ncbi:MAG: hypothetical protein JJE04_09255 [Acidobacteriia bacterium]|nr:hypothetical protein [Terriglobia bacterium]